MSWIEAFWFMFLSELVPPLLMAGIVVFFLLYMYNRKD